MLLPWLSNAHKRLPHLGKCCDSHDSRLFETIVIHLVGRPCPGSTARASSDEQMEPFPRRPRGNGLPTVRPVHHPSDDRKSIFPLADSNTITDPNDPRVVAFRNIRETSATGRPGDTFIAEGRWVTQRLLESPHPVKAVLVAEGNQAQWRAQIDASRPIDSRPELLVASKPVLQSIVGFDFHRGVIGCGVRPDIPSVNQMDQQSAGHSLDVFLDGISDAENVGNIVRTAAALGIERIILGPGTVDPFRRRVIRVSMASVLEQSFYRANDSARAIEGLVRRGHRVIATTLGSQADDLATFQRDGRPMVLVMGNESTGITAEVQDLATDRVRIPMSGDVDSMNVASAAAIFLWRLLL